MERIREETGAQIAEFAILLPALVPLLFGPLAIQRMYSEYQVVAQAAAEGARITAIRGRAEGQTRIAEMLEAGGARDATWIIEGPAGWGSPVRVTVSKRHLLSVPLLWQRELILSARREARSERE